VQKTQEGYLMKAMNNCSNISAALSAPTSLLLRLSVRQRGTKFQKLLLSAMLMLVNLYFSISALAETECKQAIRDIYASKSPAVVQISALTINPYRMDDRVNLATGSGFIIDSNGLVITNSHVVFGAQSLSITLNDGTKLPAKLLGADPILDLAVLHIPVPNKGKLPMLTLGNSDAIRPGDEVVIIGNPMGLDRTITSGIISAINRILHNRPRMLSRAVIQTDAPINPGNSGGPMLNRCGDVIGITSAILGNAQNIGFAIPSNLAGAVVAELVDNGRLIRPWFGIDGNLINAEMKEIFALPLADGFLVEAVEPNSPAGLAGIAGGRIPVKVGFQSLIMGGDIIVEINDIKLKDLDSLMRGFNLIRIGAQLRLKISRDGKVFTKELTITERPLQPGDVPESSQYFSVQKEQESSAGKPALRP
jgi:S1-C subfamily serine protease